MTMFFQIAAFAVLIMFYGCYLGKMLSQRRSGIRTDQMGVGKTGFTKWVEIIMKIATYLTVLAEVISIALGTTRLPVWLRLSGLFLSLTGVVFFSLAVMTMKDSWRAGVSSTDKTEFVTRGIFQISRNPAFLGFDLVYIGIVMMFYNPWLLAVSFIAYAMLHLQIVNNEEPFLADTFGEEYMAYSRHVNRYLGRRKAK